MNAIETKMPKTGYLQGLLRWLRCPPNESDSFGVNMRKAIQSIWGTVCEWEQRTDPGEEEHGKNPAKRYCTKCGKCQHGFYHQFGDTRTTWEDET